jgi:hypothetical protein
MFSLFHLFFDKCEWPLGIFVQFRLPLTRNTLKSGSWKPIRKISDCIYNELSDFLLKGLLTKGNHIHHPHPHNHRLTEMVHHFSNQSHKRVAFMRFNRVAVGNLQNDRTGFSIFQR